MFDVSVAELMLIALVGLLVIGPEKLPETLRTLGLWFGRLRRSFTSVKAEIEKEIGMDDVRRQLHNESIMAEMKRIEDEVKSSVDDVKSSVNEAQNSIHSFSNPTAQQPATDSPTSEELPSTTPSETDSAAMKEPTEPTQKESNGTHGQS